MYSFHILQCPSASCFHSYFSASHVLQLVTGSVLQVAKERAQIPVVYVDAPAHGRMVAFEDIIPMAVVVKHTEASGSDRAFAEAMTQHGGDQLLKPVVMCTVGVHLLLYLRHRVRDIGGRKQRQTVYDDRDVDITSIRFLRPTAGTAIARLSHRNSLCLSVCLSVTRVDQAKTVQARIIKSSPSAAPKTSFRICNAFPKIP